MVAVCYDGEHQLVCFKASHILDLQGIIQAVQTWMAHPQFAPDTNMLWDLSHSQWMPAVEEFSLVSEPIITKINKIWRGEKIACVVNSATEAALIDTQLGSFGWYATWRGFTSCAEAKHWLYDAK